jgi:enamine deaminase RidA (YjgF/YER057c/UK114 family)
MAFRLLLTAFLLVAPAFAAGETPEERLAAKGLTLPPATAPVAAYVTSVRVGNLLFLSGHGECGETLKSGKVGRDLTVEEGAHSAQRVGLCMLATIREALGDLSKVKRFVRILGMVNATEGFTHHPQVMNGFSELMVTAFGEAGLAARASVGMSSLPFDIPVEIEAIVEVEE